MVLNKMNKFLAIPIVVLLSLSVALVSCGSPTPTPTPTPSSQPPVSSPVVPPPTTAQPTVTQLSGTVTEAGSTTVQPLAEAFATAFMKINPKIVVTIQGGGTAVGIKSANDGTVDIGAASAELAATDPQLQKFILARDGIAIVTNNAISLAAAAPTPGGTPIANNLSKQQVSDIFSGKITNWKDVGGKDAKIDVVTREEGSGTRVAFTSLVMGTANITNTAIVQSSNGALMQTVLSDPNAIGYLSLGYLDNTVTALSVNGIACTAANAKSGVYPIVRPLYFLTKNPPTGVVKTFIDYCQSDAAQTIVTSNGYVSVK